MLPEYDAAGSAPSARDIRNSGKWSERIKDDLPDDPMTLLPNEHQAYWTNTNWRVLVIDDLAETLDWHSQNQNVSKFMYVQCVI